MKNSFPSRPLVIDMLNTGSAGGAAVAAFRLREGLLAVGEDCRLWNKPPGRRHRAQESAGKPLSLARGSQWLNQLRSVRTRWNDKRNLKGRPEGLELFTPPWRAIPTPHDPERLSGDLLHLHWVNRWIDWKSFFAAVPDHHPIVWTLHDMNPITGGCHHSDGCESFHHGCGHCPQLALRNRGPADISRAGYEAKRLAYEAKNLHFVTPSRWLQRHAESSGLSRFATVQTIHNGLDVGQFRPLDKSKSRHALGIPPDKTVIGFGAASLANTRKGIAEFYQAVSQLPDRSKVLCLGFGERTETPPIDGLPEIHTTGYLSTPDELARVYSAADLFVMPSLGENMPQTVIESMACGTPTVAFSVGGIPEVVVPDRTGLLADLSDCDQLAAQIQRMIDHPESRLAMGARGRELICAEFDLERQAQKYVRLYENAIRASEVRPRHLPIKHDLPKSA